MEQLSYCKWDEEIVKLVRYEAHEISTCVNFSREYSTRKQWKSNIYVTWPYSFITAVIRILQNDVEGNGALKAITKYNRYINELSVKLYD